MKNVLVRCLCVIFLSFMFLLQLSAQNIQRFEYYGSEEGLSQNSVYSLMCDRKGFLWIGTMAGLNRFDGKEFRLFKDLSGKLDASTSNNNRVENIWEDKCDHVWLQNYDGCYQYFNQHNEQFGIVPQQTSSILESAISFVQYTDSMVVICTEKSGLYFMTMQCNHQYDVEIVNYEDIISGDVRNLQIRSLYADANKNLWLATEEGLYRLRYRNLLKKNYKAEPCFYGVAFGKAIAEVGTVVVFAPEKKGLLLFDTQKDVFLSEKLGDLFDGYSFTNIVSLPGKGVVVTSSNAQTKLLDEHMVEIADIKYNGRGRDEVQKIYVDKYQQMWLTTLKPGITRYSIGNGVTRYYNLIPPELAASVDLERPVFAEDTDGNFWIGLHGGGLLWYDRMSDDFKHFRNNLQDDSTIPSNVVHCILQDKSGCLWLGTGQYKGGLVKVVSENRAFVNNIPDKDALQPTDNVVRCLFEDAGKNLWVATKSGKIYIYNTQGKVIRVLDGLPTVNGVEHSVAYGICEDYKGRLWIATKGQGLFRMKYTLDYKNIARERIVFEHFNLENGFLSDDYAYSVVEDRGHNIWVATYGGGLTRLKEDNDGSYSCKVFNRDNSNLLSNKVRYLMVANDGALWVATTNGVCKLECNKLCDEDVVFEHFVHQSNNNSLSYNDICHIFQDKQGHFYFATIGGGLDILNYDKNGNRIFDHYDTFNGLCNNVVYSVTEDNGGCLWITTENGISRMDVKNHSFESFNDNNGLSFNSFSEATQQKLSDGRIAFGGYRGFITVSPLQVGTQQYRSQLILTGLQIENTEQKVQEDGPLTESIIFANNVNLNYTQTSISITYKAIDYQSSSYTRYKYKLDGFDKEWRDVGTQTRAVYTNLQPGNYVFKVRHTYKNGAWSEDDCNLNITIDAPWWRTKLAYMLYVVLFVTLLWLVISVVARIKGYRQQLDIEKNLNHIKLQFFTNVAHEIRTPLTLISAPIDSLMHQDLPAKAIQELVIMKRNTGRLQTLLNQLLDFRKIQNNKMHLQVSKVNVSDFVMPICESFKMLASHKKLVYSVVIDEGLQDIWIDPKELDTVIYNLLSNAMKFTESGKKVEVRVRQTIDETFIEVLDEGRGIANLNPDVLFKRYTILSTNDLSGTGIGLSLSYELVKLHQGELLVTSQVGMGSSFIVKLKNGYKHFENIESVTICSGDEKNIQTNSILNPENLLQVVGDEDSDLESEDNISISDVKKTLLLVEDNVEILNYLRETLSIAYSCLSAQNGNEALLLLAQHSVDLIVTDIMMPVMDGNAMINEIKHNFATSHIPIIALTAKDSADAQIEAFKAGVDAYLTKPFNLDHLKAVVANLISKREAYTRKLAGTDSQRNVEKENVIVADEIAEQPIGSAIPSKDEEFIRELILFAETNYHDDLNIDKFAEHFNMSRTVFYNKVKGLTGQSPLEFVRQLKFKIADQLLRKGYNVSEVAFEIGYSDVKYFSKQYKQIYGMPPSQIKKSTVESDNN